MAVSALPRLAWLGRARGHATSVAADRASTACEWAIMDIEAYRNQLAPWLGPGHAQWLAEHSSPGPAPHLVRVARPLYEAFLARRYYRGITPEEETRLGLPHRTPPPFARDVYRP